MKHINLRDYYPAQYKSDCFIEVPDEVEHIFTASKRKEASYRRCKYYNKAQYSLDREDGIENHILNSEPSAEEVYEQASIAKHLAEAIYTLPEKQTRRIYAHYFSGVSKAAIARAEGVTRQVIDASIRSGLESIRNFMKKYL